MANGKWQMKRLEISARSFIMLQFPGGFTSEGIEVAGILKFSGGSGRLGSNAATSFARNLATLEFKRQLFIPRPGLDVFFTVFKFDLAASGDLRRQRKARQEPTSRKNFPIR